MSGGWKGSQRRKALPPNWTETRKRILVRDRYACQHERQDTGRLCLRAARDVDHIVPAHKGGSEADANLQALCPWHHTRKSASEGGRASADARERRAPTKPRHPGLLP